MSADGPRGAQGPDRRRPAVRGLLGWASAALAVAAFLASVAANAVGNSATADEPYHLASGVSVLEEGALAMFVEQPPLARSVAALPVAAMDLEPVAEHRRRAGSAYRGAHSWLFDNRMLADTVLLVGRLPYVALGLALVLVTGAVARRFYGRWAGWLALVLAAGCIPLAAHTPVIHTDVPFALAVLLTVAALVRFLDRPGWGAAAALAGCLGAALAVKYTAIHLVAAVVLVVLLDALRRAGREGRKAAWRRLLGLGGALAGGVLLLLAVYAWAMRSSPPGLAEWMVGAAVKVPAWEPALKAATRTVPPLGQYLTGLAVVLQQNAFGRLSYLNGELSLHGFPLYFPEAMALKSQLGFLLLLLARPFVRGQERDRFAVALLVPAAYLLAAAIPSAFNIGVRHMLPLYPLLIVWAAGILRGGPGRTPRWAGVAAAIAVGWCWTAFLVAHPHHIAYFNELAGGSANGARFLVSSNVDWGQDVKRLGRWAERYGVERMDTLTFGPAPVERYLPGASPVGPGWEPSAEHLAVSAYLETLGPAYYQVYGPPEMVPVMERIEALVAGRRPVATVGHSIRVYRIGEP